MPDHRYEARRSFASNAPDGPEDRNRDMRGRNALSSSLGFGNDDPPGEYGRGAQSWGQANEGGNWGSGHRQPERGHYGPQHGYGGFQGDFSGGKGQGGFGGRGDWEAGRQSFSGRRFGPQDEQYLSWRDRHIAELDRDYEDYCRECGEDFSSAFSSWRRDRLSAGSEADRSDMTSGASGSTSSSAGDAKPKG